MGKNNKLYLLTPKGRNSTKLTAPKLPFDQDRNDSSSFIPPKHVQLPIFSEENEILYELQTMVLFIISMSTQYLNLFRTYWWTSESYRRFAMNFHLINYSIVTFCFFTISRPLVIFVFYKLYRFLPDCFQFVYVHLISASIFLLVGYYQLYHLSLIYTYHSVQDCLIVLAPIFVHFLLYYSEYYHALQWTRNNFTSKLDMFLQLTQLWLMPSNYMPMVNHACNNTSGYSVRNEVDKFKKMFNDRIKFIAVRSILVGYYGSLVPIFLLSADHEYDQFWTLQHVVVGWLCTAFMLTSHLYSPQFYDTLHQASLHLGKWQKLEQRNCIVPCFTWTDSSIYGPGIVVRHAKEYYKSEANMTCAEPGNHGHYRFYFIFSNPAFGFLFLLIVLFLVVFYQFGMLCLTNEWYKLISMSLMMLTNSLAIFRLVRTYFILKVVYKNEKRYTDPKFE